MPLRAKKCNVAPKNEKDDCSKQVNIPEGSKAGVCQIECEHFSMNIFYKVDGRELKLDIQKPQVKCEKQISNTCITVIDGKALPNGRKRRSPGYLRNKCDLRRVASAMNHSGQQLSDQNMQTRSRSPYIQHEDLKSFKRKETVQESILKEQKSVLEYILKVKSAEIKKYKEKIKNMQMVGIRPGKTNMRSGSGSGCTKKSKGIETPSWSATQSEIFNQRDECEGSNSMNKAKQKGVDVGTSIEDKFNIQFRDAEVYPIDFPTETKNDITNTVDHIMHQSLEKNNKNELVNVLSVEFKKCSEDMNYNSYTGGYENQSEDSVLSKKLIEVQDISSKRRKDDSNTRMSKKCILDNDNDIVPTDPIKPKAHSKPSSKKNGTVSKHKKSKQNVLENTRLVLNASDKQFTITFMEPSPGRTRNDNDYLEIGKLPNKVQKCLEHTPTEKVEDTSFSHLNKILVEMNTLKSGFDHVAKISDHTISVGISIQPSRFMAKQKDTNFHGKEVVHKMSQSEKEIQVVDYECVESLKPSNTSIDNVLSSFVENNFSNEIRNNKQSNKLPPSDSLSMPFLPSKLADKYLKHFNAKKRRDTIDDDNFRNGFDAERKGNYTRRNDFKYVDLNTGKGENNSAKKYNKNEKQIHNGEKTSNKNKKGNAKGKEKQIRNYIPRGSVSETRLSFLNHIKRDKDNIVTQDYMVQRFFKEVLEDDKNISKLAEKFKEYNAKKKFPEDIFKVDSAANDFQLIKDISAPNSEIFHINKNSPKKNKVKLSKPTSKKSNSRPNTVKEKVNNEFPNNTKKTVLSRKATMASIDESLPINSKKMQSKKVIIELKDTGIVEDENLNNRKPIFNQKLAQDLRAMVEAEIQSRIKKAIQNKKVPHIELKKITEDEKRDIIKTIYKKMLEIHPLAAEELQMKTDQNIKPTIEPGHSIELKSVPNKTKPSKEDLAVAKQCPGRAKLCEVNQGIRKTAPYVNLPGNRNKHGDNMRLLITKRGVENASKKTLDKSKYTHNKGKFGGFVAPYKHEADILKFRARCYDNLEKKSNVETQNNCCKSPIIEQIKNPTVLSSNSGNGNVGNLRPSSKATMPDFNIDSIGQTDANSKSTMPDFNIDSGIIEDVQKRRTHQFEEGVVPNQNSKDVGIQKGPEGPGVSDLEAEAEQKQKMKKSTNECSTLSDFSEEDGASGKDCSRKSKRSKDQSGLQTPTKVKSPKNEKISKQSGKCNDLNDINSCKNISLKTVGYGTMKHENPFKYSEDVQLIGDSAKELNLKSPNMEAIFCENATTSVDHPVCSAEYDIKMKSESRINLEPKISNLEFMICLGYNLQEAREILKDYEISLQLSDALREMQRSVSSLSHSQGNLVIDLSIKLKEFPRVKRYFNFFVEGIMNYRITDAIELDGFIKLLDCIEKKRYPRRSNDCYSKMKMKGNDFKKEDRRKLLKTFLDIYQVAATEVYEPLNVQSVEMVRKLAEKARAVNNELPLARAKLISEYIGRGAIRSNEHLDICISFMICNRFKKLNVNEFERHCNLPPLN